MVLVSRFHLVPNIEMTSTFQIRPSGGNALTKISRIRGSVPEMETVRGKSFGDTFESFNSRGYSTQTDDEIVYINLLRCESKQYVDRHVEQFIQNHVQKKG